MDIDHLTAHAARILSLALALLLIVDRLAAWAAN